MVESTGEVGLNESDTSSAQTITVVINHSEVLFFEPHLPKACKILQTALSERCGCTLT